MEKLSESVGSRGLAMARLGPSEPRELRPQAIPFFL